MKPSQWGQFSPSFLGAEARLLQTTQKRRFISHKHLLRFVNGGTVRLTA